MQEQNRRQPIELHVFILSPEERPMLQDVAKCRCGDLPGEGILLVEVRWTEHLQVISREDEKLEKQV